MSSQPLLRGVRVQDEGFGILPTKEKQTEKDMQHELENLTGHSVYLGVYVARVQGPTSAWHKVLG